MNLRQLFKVLQCFFIGHRDIQIILTLGKIVPESVEALTGSRVDESKFGKYGKLLRNWGALGAFVAAATPIPDDPIVIPLGLMKHNIVKFGVSYFLGKVTITLIGATLPEAPV